MRQNLVLAKTVASARLIAKHPSTFGGCSDKGKPVERRGRKATGLKTQVYGSGVATLSLGSPSETHFVLLVSCAP